MGGLRGLGRLGGLRRVGRVGRVGQVGQVGVRAAQAIMGRVRQVSVKSVLEKNVNLLKKKFLLLNISVKNSGLLSKL